MNKKSHTVVTYQYNDGLLRFNKFTKYLKTNEFKIEAMTDEQVKKALRRRDPVFIEAYKEAVSILKSNVSSAVSCLDELIKLSYE